MAFHEHYDCQLKTYFFDRVFLIFNSPEISMNFYLNQISHWMRTEFYFTFNDPAMYCSYTSILATSHQNLYFVTPIILKLSWEMILKSSGKGVKQNCSFLWVHWKDPFVGPFSSSFVALRGQRGEWGKLYDFFRFLKQLFILGLIF